MDNKKLTYQELEDKYHQLENELFLYKSGITEKLLKEKNNEIETQNEELLQATIEIEYAKEKAEAGNKLKDELLKKFNESQKIAQIGSWELNMVTNQVWWSQETYHIFGLNPEEFVPDFDFIANYVHPDDKDDYFRIFADCIQTGDALNHDFRIKNPLANIKYCSVQGKVIFSDNKPEKFIGTILDISLRKEIEIALKESENRFRLSLKNTPLTVAAQDRNLRFIWAYNQKTESPIAIIDKTDHDIFPPEYADKLVSLKLQVLREEKEISEKLWIHSNGKDLFIELYIEPLRDENQKVIGVAIATIDMTKEKLAQDALKYEQSLLQALMESVPDHIYFKDRESRFIRINNSHAQSFGLNDPENAVGKTDFDFFTQEHAQQAFYDEQEIILTGMPISKEEKQTWADCPDTWVVSTKMPLYNKDAKIIGTFGISKDVTEKKQAELIISRQNIELQQLNSDKDRFISILAHDLKNPFSSILGFSHVLAKNIRKYNIDKIEQQVNIINTSTKRVYNLLEDILLWINAQSGKLVFDPKEFDFLTNCDEVIGNLKTIAISKNIKIEHLNEAGIRICADINMFKTILRNLVSNAIKYTNNGGNICIGAVKENSNMLISVSDNGIGIEPEKINKLFDITQMQTTTGTAGESGTGLGLLICKEFVEKHGGKIWVESKFGVGSDFKFTLPLY